MLLAVDAIQAVGAVRLGVGAADLVAFGGHKWLCAMQGLGAVYVADSVLDRLRVSRGWLNGPVDWDDFEATTLDLHDDATRFRTGTLPTAQAYALDAALGLFLDVGMETVERAVRGHAARLAEGLGALGLRRYGTGDPDRQSGIVAVRAGDAPGLHAHLDARGVACSLRNGLVRFSPHAHTRDADVDRALEAVAGFGRLAVPAS